MPNNLPDVLALLSVRPLHSLRFTQGSWRQFLDDHVEHELPFSPPICRVQANDGVNVTIVMKGFVIEVAEPRRYNVSENLVTVLKKS